MDDANNAFAKMVPGYDFLQNLMKSASASMPSGGAWVAPTLDPEELDKRINELRTVQFWLEQNARMLGATIQGLEVQKLTLTTLRQMNVSFADLTESLKVKLPDPPGGAPAEAGSPSSAAAPVDPMQWWGALTQQFTTLAANAMKDSAAAATAASPMAGTPAPSSAPEAGAGSAAGEASTAATAKRSSPKR